MKRIIKYLASLKLAVFTISALCVLSAIGTFVEARYDLQIAHKLVYNTHWMRAALALLAVNLIAVMVDRWPWQKRHTPFILAHIGILVMMVGFILSSYGLRFFGLEIIPKGLDGTVRVGVGESNRFVVLPITDFIIWSSFDGDRYTKVFEKEVDFFLKNPKENPLSIPLVEGNLVVKDFIPFALAKKDVGPSESPQSGAGVRIKIQNAFTNVSEWLIQMRKGQETSLKLGPVDVFLGKKPDLLLKENVVFLNLIEGETKPRLAYTLTYKDPSKKPRQGVIDESQSIETGWMNSQLTLLRYLPRAEETWEFVPTEKPTPLTTSAVRIEFQGRDRWTQLNDVMKFFTEGTVYLVTYAHRRMDLGFDLQLKRFEMGKYQGTMRAASYASDVYVDGIGERRISMNEPLKHKGLTIYQASFQENEAGVPIASIFSVNQDPGRFLKYLGSFILSSGVILLFWQKRRAARAAAPKQGAL